MMQADHEGLNMFLFTAKSKNRFNAQYSVRYHQIYMLLFLESIFLSKVKTEKKTPANLVGH